MIRNDGDGKAVDSETKIPVESDSQADAAMQHYVASSEATRRYLATLSQAVGSATPLLVLAQRLCCFLCVSSRDIVLQKIQETILIAPEAFVVVFEGKEEDAGIFDRSDEDSNEGDAPRNDDDEQNVTSLSEMTKTLTEDVGTRFTNSNRRIIVMDPRKRLRAALCESAIGNKDQFHQDAVLQRLWQD